VNALELAHVVKHYPARGETVRAVDGVSLRVEPGEFAALYGPSGSGKTTLLLLAAALMEPDSGSVMFGGSDIAHLSAQDAARYRRTDVGFVFQTFHLVPAASALDNAALKLLSEGLSLGQARHKARPWLERVGLGSRISHTPRELSKGEQQRVAIARALANDRRLLLVDEPTGNLDSHRSRELLTLLRELCDEREIPVLLVTHDPEAATYADRVCTLRDGLLDDGLDTHSARAASR
jgi:putative ABC transport system ATP-binding protein